MEYLLKDNRKINIRKAFDFDAPEIIEVIKAGDTESDFLVREPNEFDISVEDEINYIHTIDNDPLSLMYVATLDSQVIALADIEPISHFSRLKHRGQISLLVLEFYSNLGVGTSLLDYGIKIARLLGYESLELEVVDTNYAAINIYKKFGFVEYGKRNNSLKYQDSTYANTILMRLDL